MITLSVDADIPAGEDLLGKSVTDLQEEIEVGEDKITGTLKWVTGYTGFSSSPELQEGNFLALHAETDDPADEIWVEVVNGYYGRSKLDSDGLVVLRIEDNETQKVKFTATCAAGKSVEKVYDLSDMTMVPETETVALADADANEDSEYSEQELQALTKGQLLELAETLGVTGVSSANTKAQIIAAILAAQQ